MKQNCIPHIVFLIVFVFMLVFSSVSQTMAPPTHKIPSYDDVVILTYYEEYHYSDTSFIHVTTKSQFIVDDLCNSSLIDEDWNNVWEVSMGLNTKFDWLQLRYNMVNREKILNIVLENPYNVETLIYNRVNRKYYTKRRIKKNSRKNG